MDEFEMDYVAAVRLLYQLGRFSREEASSLQSLAWNGQQPSPHLYSSLELIFLARVRCPSRMLH
jgi:hypothetical protein